MCDKIRSWSWTERQNGWEVIRRHDITGENKVQWLHLSLLVCYRAAKGEQSLSSLCSRSAGFTCSAFIQGISENNPLSNSPNNLGQINLYLDHVGISVWKPWTEHRAFIDATYTNTIPFTEFAQFYFNYFFCCFYCLCGLHEYISMKSSYEKSTKTKT